CSSARRGAGPCGGGSCAASRAETGRGGLGGPAALARVETAGGLAELPLDNPPLNLVTLELTRRLHAALDRLAASPDVRVLIVTGAGARAFCAGSDVAEFPSVADDVVARKLALENDAWSRPHPFPPPTIPPLNRL